MSEEYQGAIAYVVDERKQIGAKISYCRAGNIKAGLPGTGHDSALLADVTKTGRILVPYEKGRSHCPEQLPGWKIVVWGAIYSRRPRLRLPNPLDF